MAGFVVHLAKKVIFEEIINEIYNDDPKWKTFKILEKRWNYDYSNSGTDGRR